MEYETPELLQNSGTYLTRISRVLELADIMVMYCLAIWKGSTLGKVADLPPNTGYVLLAIPSYDSDFGLFECELSDDDKSRLVEEVQNDLFQLLESAKNQLF